MPPTSPLGTQRIRSSRAHEVKHHDLLARILPSSTKGIRFSSTKATHTAHHLRPTEQTDRQVCTRPQDHSTLQLGEKSNPSITSGRRSLAFNSAKVKSIFPAITSSRKAPHHWRDRRWLITIEKALGIGTTLRARTGSEALVGRRIKRMRSTSATWTMWSRTAKSLLSTLHRPPDPGALERRACINRSKPRKASTSARKTDARDHYLPELLSPLQEVERNDSTAETEAAEFEKITNSKFVVIPTNKPMLRLENSDVVFRTTKEKYKAVADEIAELHEKKQPVLVGTNPSRRASCSRESSSARRAARCAQREISRARSGDRSAGGPTRDGHDFNQHGAGRWSPTFCSADNADFMTRQELVKKGSRTRHQRRRGSHQSIAPKGFLRFYYQGQEFEVSEPDWAEANQVHASAPKQDHERCDCRGWLFILGTERHEIERIDNQLRGRAGRQGDPGASRFYLSL